MKKNKDAISFPSAEERECIDAEKEAMPGTSQTGVIESFAAESNEEKTAEFEELISKKYKEQFCAKVQKIISRRLKEVKQLKETADKNAAIIKLLMEKLNVENGDTEKLERVIETMKKPDASEETKINPAHEKLLRRLIAENNYLKKDRDAKLRNMQTRERAAKLREEVTEAKKLYPEFNFEKEIKNPEFVRLLRIGVSVKIAYAVVNIESILEKNSKDAEKKVVDAIRSKGSRPVENGSESTSGILLANNVSKLTKKQRAELAKRAAQGERIAF